MAKRVIEINIAARADQARRELQAFGQDLNKAEKHIKGLGDAGRNAAAGLAHMKEQASSSASSIKGLGEESGGITKVFGEMKGALLAVAAAIGAFKAIHTVTEFLKEGSEEAAKQELALKGLHATLTATERATGNFEQSMIDLSATMMKQTGFADDVVQNTVKVLSVFDEISNEQMPRVLKISADLARGWGMDLPEAARLVGMASLGMMRGLKQVGIKMDEEKLKTVGFGGVLDELEQKVKGQAEAYISTSKGLSTYMNTMTGEVKEQFGVIVNQVLDPFKKVAGDVLTVLAGKLAEWVKTVDLKEWATSVAAKLGELATLTLPKLMEILETLPSKIKNGLDEAGKTIDLIKSKFEALVLTVKLTIDANRILFGLWMNPGKFTAELMKGEGPIFKMYDDITQGIESIKKEHEDAMKALEQSSIAAKDKIEGEPIAPQIDLKDVDISYEALLEVHRRVKAEMERNPIRIRIEYVNPGPEEIQPGKGTFSQIGSKYGGIIKRQSGGVISGYGGGDKIPILGEAGEFMIRKEAVRKFGVGFFNTLNSMTMPKPSDRVVLDFRIGERSYPVTTDRNAVFKQLIRDIRNRDLVEG